ncbi:cation:proton antiporter [Chondrinema litorale]|uniref:cation:proton antiporter domain-containing protein n=1 Tax=Chondrinema litorale TaxID=2994555 RepID=UPI00254321DC|nr:cation:proton antiporter [Chondrinema litorale]UZR99947.1 cation:proton antiporter [Chondrinema litorale]
MYIIFAIQVDPVLSILVVLSIGIILTSFVFKLLKQPYIIAYILVGIFMGPNGMQIVTDESLISNLGSFGLVLLLFFIGMEISLPKLIANWRISVFGTLIQVVFSVGAVWIVGYFLNWQLEHIIVLGFVISLSSSAIVINFLQNKDLISSKVGQNVIGILLIQDVLVIPMLIIINYISGAIPQPKDIIKQIIGAGLILGIIIWILKNKKIKLPFGTYIRKDHEIQVFIAFAFCFGFSIITTFFGLSSALGAFVAGIIVSSAEETKWVQNSLYAFRIIFVALFFVSIGMLIDLSFLIENIGIVSIMVLLAFLTNNLINTIIVRVLGERWSDSFYTGAILAQIGEFSFILGATSYFIGLISGYTYQLIISTISITLIISPFWIFLVGKIIAKSKKASLDSQKSI